MADGLDPYKILQVDPEAEDEVVQAAYRRLARKYHPDLAPGPEAAARMRTINAAWELIGGPERRAAYDGSRTRASRASSAGGPTTSAPGGTTSGSAGGSWAGTRSGSAAGSSAEAPGSASGSVSGGGSASGSSAGARSTPPPETVSRDWSGGRSTTGGGYDPTTMRAAEGFGAAGPPPGNASGSVLTFSRYAGWSLGEIARHDLEFLEWLDRAPIGRQYRDEVDQILRRAGRRRSAESEATERRGLFRRP